MRRIHLVLELVIDDRDRVTVDKLSYEVRGKHDAPLADGVVSPESVVVTREEQRAEPSVSPVAQEEALALLLSLGFDVSEGQKYIAAKSVARIREVVRWIRMKNNVGSPKALATKLLGL